jgi:hypothetical protein
MYDGIGAYDSLSHVDRYTKSVEKASHFLKACLDADKVLGDSIQFEALRQVASLASNSKCESLVLSGRMLVNTFSTKRYRSAFRGE